MDIIVSGYIGIPKKGPIYDHQNPLDIRKIKESDAIWTYCYSKPRKGLAIYKDSLLVALHSIEKWIDAQK